MPAAPSLIDDTLRQRLLERLELLDPRPDEALDRITRMTAELLGMPIALVSLIDERRQWFRSRHGLSEREAPRDIAFCVHALHAGRTLVVPDAAADPRFADNPLVTGPHAVRFYAGVPLTTAEGVALGTLCVADHRPRELSAREQALLEDLAALARRELLNREAVITARELAAAQTQALARSEALFRATFEQAAIGIAVVDRAGHWQHFNDRVCQILGRSGDALRALTVADVTHPEDMPLDAAQARRLARGQIDHYTVEKRYLRPDGALVWATVSVALVRHADEPGGLVAAIEDITARKDAEASLRFLHEQLEAKVQARTAELESTNRQLADAMRRQTEVEAELRTSEHELRSVLEHASDAYVSADARGRVLAWNRQAEAMFGWSATEAVGRPLVDLIIPPSLAAMHRDLFARADGQTISGRRLEVLTRTRDGRDLPCEVSLSALDTPRGRIYSAFIHDITERKLFQRSLELQAMQDPLTGLPNRRALLARLEDALKRSRRSGQPLALLFLDLDGFKAVNDTHGHEAGVAVLRTFASRLNACVRDTDLVARLAGDEFVVLLEQATDATPVAQRVRHAAQQPFALDPVAPVQLDTSIGIAHSVPGQRAETLLAEADRQMYEVKRAAKAAIAGA